MTKEGSTPDEFSESTRGRKSGDPDARERREQALSYLEGLANQPPGYARLIYRVQEATYCLTAAYMAFAWGPVTGTRLDLAPDLSLKQLLIKAGITESPLLDGAIAGIASRYENRLRPGRPLARSLGEKAAEVLSADRDLKRLGQDAPLSSHLLMLQAIAPQIVALIPDWS